jgi:hypothetical protein
MHACEEKIKCGVFPFDELDALARAHADHIANKMGKKPEEMGMKGVEESTVAPMKLLFGDGLKSVR